MTNSYPKQHKNNKKFNYVYVKKAAFNFNLGHAARYYLGFSISVCFRNVPIPHPPFSPTLFLSFCSQLLLYNIGWACSCPHHTTHLTYFITLPQSPFRIATHHLH
ncbi:unnamed protein product, partial [Vitis vinifera]